MSRRLAAFIRDLQGLGALAEAMSPPPATEGEIVMREVAPGVFASSPRPQRARRHVLELDTHQQTARRVRDGLTELQRSALELARQRRGQP